MKPINFHFNRLKYIKRIKICQELKIMREEIFTIFEQSFVSIANAWNGAKYLQFVAMLHRWRGELVNCVCRTDVFGYFCSRLVFTLVSNFGPIAKIQLCNNQKVNISFI